jgi:fatty-acid peroxygenase
MAAARGRASPFLPGSVAQAVAEFREANGLHPSPRTAAVELINMLRPVVAVSVYIVHMADALERHPEWRPRVRDSESDRRLFVQEVRRHYPLFPAILAIARRDLSWQGYDLPAGHRVMIDFHATCRHPDHWDRADEFRPERFNGVRPDPFLMIPQGGGDHMEGHRCAGEWITIALMERAVRRLAALPYRHVGTSHELRWRRLPPVAEGGFRMEIA